MELRVESVEGSSLPAGCFIGVRVGDVLKQGRYEPQRCYHFPNVDRRKNAKIDVYQHVGSCVVAVDPDIKSTHEVNVAATDPTLPSMRLKVNVHSNTDDLGKQQKETRTKQLKSQAKDYLSRHRIEERLSDAVKSLLKEQPADPTEFLCRVLRGETGDELKSAHPPACHEAAVDKPLLKPLYKLAQAKAPELEKIEKAALKKAAEAEKDIHVAAQEPKKHDCNAATVVSTQEKHTSDGPSQTKADSDQGKVAQELTTENAVRRAEGNKTAPLSAPLENGADTNAKDATAVLSANVSIVSAPAPLVVTATEMANVQAPMMLPTMTMMGSSFASSGMPPSLMFF